MRGIDRNYPIEFINQAKDYSYLQHNIYCQPLNCIYSGNKMGWVTMHHYKHVTL